MRLLSFKTSLDAFQGINEYLIYRVDGVSVDGIVSSSQNIMYNTFIKIHKSFIPEDWDFTKTVNYRMAKWVSLVNNYVDKGYLQEVLAEVQSRELKKASSYNISFHFSNSHGGGKGCLLTCTFTRRPGVNSPILIVNTRASEVYKRLMVDLLLIHRIGQAAYGEAGDFSVEIFMPHAWQGVSWAAMWMSWQRGRYLAELELKFGSNVFCDSVKKRLSDFSTREIESFSYNADKRAAKVIQGLIASPSLLAKGCLL